MSGVPDYGALMDAEAAAAPGASADPAAASPAATAAPVINEALPAATAPTGVPDYGAMMDQEAAGAARLGYQVAQGTDPDQYARAQQLARELGIPTQTALADAEALQRKRAAGEIDFDKIARENPQTAGLLADPERAKIAHDDVPGLQSAETTAKGWGQSFADAPAELIKGLGGSFNRSAGSVNLLLGAAPVVYDKAASLLTGRVHTEASDAWFGHMVAPVVERQAQFEPDANAVFPEKLASTLGSLAGTLSQITLSGTTAAPVAPAALGLPAMQEVVGGAVAHGTKAMLFPAASDAADTARQVYAETGGDAGAAIRAAEAKYATTSAMGVLPMSAPGGAFARIGSGAVSGVAGGEAGRVVNNLALPDQMQTPLSAEDLALQAVTGSVLAIGGPRGANAARLHAARVESAKRASQGAALLAQLNKLAEASKVRARDPAQAQAFFQSILNEGRDAVWISPKALAESGLSERIIAEIPGVAEQVQTAVETQHDIRLPIADLMARMAGPELEQGIIPHVSTEPGGFTAKTAEAYYQTGAAAELQAEVARVLGDDAAARPFKASAERVKAAILADLAEAGRHPGAHDVYATLVSQFYAVQAARLGMTPEALYKDYPIRVTARSGSGEAFGQVLPEAMPSGMEAGDGAKAAAMYRGEDQTRAVLLGQVEGQLLGEHPATSDAAKVLRDATLYVRNDGGHTESVDQSAANLKDAGETLSQDATAPRGSFSPDTLTITLHQGADLSTFLHETGHAFLELQTQLATRVAHEADGFGGALSAGERELIADTHALLKWFGVRDMDTWHAMPFEERRSHHEQFARGFEVYLHEGKAPSLELAGVFQRFRAYLLGVYRNLLDTNLDANGKRQGLGVGLDVKLNDEVRGVMDRMIASGDQIQAAEQGRALMPLFARADQAGMTVEEFRDYQALGIDATNTAIEDLQARGVRDLQWIDRARGRMVRQLQREAAGLRAQAQMDARRELLTQPVYQAWQFLTNRIGADDMLPAAVARADYLDARKAWNQDLATWEAQALAEAKQSAWESSAEGQTRYRRKATLERAQRRVAKREAAAIAADLDARRAAWKAAHPAPVESGQAPKANTNALDPERDSLFQAIAKLGGLNKDEVISTWGTDPADKPTGGVFGKPVWRRAGGRSIDGMAQALGEHGYLTLDAHGKPDLAEFERLFDAELRGSPQYSTRFDPDLAVDGGGPDYVVNPQALGAGRINRAALSDLLTDSASDPADSARIVAALDAAKMITNKGGLHPDVVADLVPGLHSGEELVRALADATPLQEALTARTDALMLERHGDLATPQALAEAADRAIFNDVRARLVTVEANALAKATGRPQILTRAAQEFAGAMVARLRVRDIRPDLYAAGAARAGKAAAKASQGGDLATAAAEKRNQVILIHATKAAYAAKAEAEGVRRKLAKFARAADDRLKGTYDLDLVNAVRAIVGQYGIAPGKAESASAYVARLKDYDPDTHASIIEQVQAAEANAKPFRDLTVDDVRALKDVTDDLLHLAKQSHRIEVDGALMSRKAIEAKLLERLTAKGIPEHMPGETSAVTPAETRLARFQEAKAFLSLVEFWAMRMDGTMQDIGPFRRYIFNLVKGRADAYRADQARVMADLKGLLDGIAPTLKPLLVHSPELNYTFGKDKSGAGMNEIVHALLHTGNASNKRKLLLGRGWAEQRADGTLDTARWDAFIARMIAEGKITQAHYDFAQGVWDLNEGMKPLAQKAHRDVFGRYFDEITAEPVPTPFGEYRGGYVPAQVDTRIVKDLALKKLVEEENANLAFAMPSTPRGFTKGRVEYNRPLLLDLRSLSQHINQVLLFSHLEVPIRGVNRLLKGIGEPLNRVDPAAINGLLTPWLAVTARQQVVTPVSADAGISRIATMLRQRAGAAAMTGNLLNGFQQLLTGFPMAARRVGWGNLLRSTGHYMRNPAEMVRAVSSASSYMDGRLNDLVHSMSDDIHEILINPGRLERAQDWTMRHSYFFQRGVDLVMTPITWTAAYNKAMGEGKSTADATALADSTVRTSQGSFLPEDVARVATGNAWWRAATQFSDYFTMWRESIETELVTADRSGGKVANAGRKAEVLLMAFLIPAVVGELVAQGFRGGPADEDRDGELWDDWLKQVFVYGPMKNASAMIPILGPSLVAGANAFNDLPYDDRMATSPTVGMIESSAKGMVALPKLLTPEELTLRNVRDMGTLVSMALGLPGTIISRPLGYLVGVENDQIRPTSGADAVRGVLTGVASPDSKVR